MDASVIPPIISDVDPARITSALSGDPDATSVALNPRASDSMATNTPTVPAIPSTATIVEVHRARTLRNVVDKWNRAHNRRRTLPERCHHAHTRNGGNQESEELLHQDQTLLSR